MGAAPRPTDPLVALRAYRQLAPWSLRDLATLAGAILESTGVRPINAAASPKPSERTIRFYVTRQLVSPPEGRGTAAVYSYRHLLEVLAIKLRQMEGATLTAIAEELAKATGDVIERRVAASIGTVLPPPRHLPLLDEETPPSGRAGRALHAHAAGIGESPAPTSEPTAAHAEAWKRLVVARGVELHVRADHPLFAGAGKSTQVRQAVRTVLARLVAHPADSETPEDPAKSGHHSD
jgi:DNA-binding transcriptional MerR regulator